MCRNPHPLGRRAELARVRDRQVFLPHMHAVGSNHRSDVGTVVHDDADEMGAKATDEGARQLVKLARGEVLCTQLDEFNTRRGKFFGEGKRGLG